MEDKVDLVKLGFLKEGELKVKILVKNKLFFLSMTAFLE